MRIGVDFDNTMVCFDGLFFEAAREKNLIPADVDTSKEKVRDYLRKVGREHDWTELQGYVYGVLIRRASSFVGVEAFFQRCREKSIPIFVISHKTEMPYLGSRHNLHDAAHAWLADHGFYGEFGLSRSEVFFELTKAEKLARIRAQGVTHFIDDLPEFLAETDFPASVQKILFDPNRLHEGESRFERRATWLELTQWLLPK